MNELDVNDLEQELAPKAKPKRKAAAKEAAAPVTPKVKALDPEEDKANWPTIFIDFEDGLPNYAFLGASGTMQDDRPFSHALQVMRGVDVVVPPSIVNMLRTSIERRTSQIPNPQTGRIDKVFTQRSGLPWHLVERGKYIK